MKRTIVAFCFVGFLICISIFSCLFLYFSTRELSERLDEMYSLAEQGRVKQAGQALSKAIQTFEEYEKTYVLIIKSTPLEGITEKIYALESYLDFNQISQFCAETKKINSLVTHIWDTEKPVLRNIL